jgi:hypothetical protein
LLPFFSSEAELNQRNSEMMAGYQTAPYKPPRQMASLTWVNDVMAKCNNHVAKGGNAMASQQQGFPQFPDLGKEGAHAMLNVQKELLDAYEQASRVWLARVKTEADFWSDLASKLTATRSVPEALGAYQESVAQRMQMAAEDGRRLFDECQKITQKLSGSLATWTPGSKPRGST